MIKIELVKFCDDNDAVLRINGKDAFFQIFDDGSDFMLSDPSDPGVALQWLKDAENSDVVYNAVSEFMNFTPRED